jgi:hypothetical protein
MGPSDFLAVFLNDFELCRFGHCQSVRQTAKIIIILREKSQA